MIPRFKGGAAVEFGRIVVFDEVEGGLVLVSRFQVLEDGVTAHDEWGPALPPHRAVCGHPPRLVTGDRDRGRHSPDKERLAREAGVRHLVLPSGGPVSPPQRAQEKDRAGRRRYRGRAGIKGRIHSWRRDYGLTRCADQGAAGLERGVGWGVLASNLRHSGQQVGARDRREHTPAA